MPRRLAALALLAALGAPGCGGGETRLPVFPSGGTITLGGKPFPKAMIRFHPVTPFPKSADGPEVANLVAETDEAGHFVLSTYRANDGAPAGDYVVTVLAGGGPDVEQADAPPRPALPAPALVKYAEPSTSPLKATVKPEGDNRFDFELK